MPTHDIHAETARRRTFAIISHPDAGKTTLTEKFLLYGGQLTSGAGAVKAANKAGGTKAVTSDWMELERQRGISITSTVLQFQYGDRVINLLDTPGHRDFSEDTYRVLAAADAAVMVLDGAKGIESQTRKLFEVCRDREIPIVTFINKWDRPGRDPLELLDEIEDQLVLDPHPISWPVGDGDRFAGVINRHAQEFIGFTRTARGATIVAEEITPLSDGLDTDNSALADDWATAQEQVDLLDAASTEFDLKRFQAGELTPVFFGSALTNFGVRLLLDSLAELVPAPTARLDANNEPRLIDSPFSAMVFKVQANMDPAHRDRVAFLRICSGQFSRGMTLINGRTDRQFSTKYAHTVLGRDRATTDEAWPGDIIGLISTGELRPGDAVYDTEPVTWPEVPTFAPSCFAQATCSDTAKTKQFRNGIRQLDSEGVVQVLHRPGRGESEPILAAVGPLQFDVAEHRLRNEFGAPVRVETASWTTARQTDEASATTLEKMSGVAVAQRLDGELLALFESPYWLARVADEHPELTLNRMVGEG